MEDQRLVLVKTSIEIEKLFRKQIDLDTLDSWNEISRFKYLNEEFMSRHKKKLNWVITTDFQPMSENFMLSHSDFVEWDFLGEKTILSMPFIKQNLYRLSFEGLMANPNYSLGQRMDIFYMFQEYKETTKSVWN
jgi:hypothetical protein